MLALQGPASAAGAGSLVVLGAQAAPAPLPAAVADALDRARTLTEQHPADLGYAWVDHATNTVVVDAVTAAGRARATAAATARVRRVPFSEARLEAIADEAIRLTSADVPDGELIYQTEPDGANDRIVITVERRSEALFRALAARYGTKAIAVRVKPGRPQALVGRTADGSPFYGGARIIAHTGGLNCTSGFSWYSGAYSKMITAGHCTPHGGWVYSGTETTANYEGNVVDGTGESWNDGTGSVPIGGTYIGDAAYIDVATGKSSAGRIYRGGPTSTTSAPVKEMWHRRPVVGDQYCTGGATKGEICGWGVASVGGSVRYYDGDVVKPVVSGMHYGYCVLPGDSGGPVYTVRTDGGIAAKGIISGGTKDLTYGDCSQYFTDIYDIYYAFPGFLKLG